jgi:hypothetical protein
LVTGPKSNFKKKNLAANEEKANDGKKEPNKEAHVRTGKKFHDRDLLAVRVSGEKIRKAASTRGSVKEDGLDQGDIMGTSANKVSRIV